MKYSSTVRTINVVLFALLTAGFGFLGIWFGFLVVPFQWRGGSGSPLASSFPSTSFGLAATLGVLGLTGAIVSLRGLIASLLSLSRNDDEIVLRGFGAYIGVGLVATMFFFTNALWLYRLTTTNFKYDDVGFVIAVYAIAGILFLFGTLIPLSKIFGDHDRYNEIMRILSFTFGAATLSVAVVFFGAYLPIAANKATTTNSDQLMLELGLGALIPFLAFVCFALALIGYRRADKTNTISKKSGFLFEGGLFLTGSAIISAGILENIFQYKELRISLMAAEVVAKNPNYLDFSVMSYIVGGLIVLASCYFALQTAKGGKAKVASEN